MLLSDAWLRSFYIQAACIPSIISGKDVIVAAETGSGKTHSYLVPLIDRLLTAHLDTSSIAEKQELPLSKRVSLVLCPNIMLCEQVARMANDLRGDDGEPLLGVAALCGRQVTIIHTFYSILRHCCANLS